VEGMINYVCSKCGAVETINDDEFGVSHMVKVAVCGKIERLCPSCYKEYGEIVHHYDNLKCSELRDWFGRKYAESITRQTEA